MQHANSIQLRVDAAALLNSMLYPFRAWRLSLPQLGFVQKPIEAIEPFLRLDIKQLGFHSLQDCLNIE